MELNLALDFVLAYVELYDEGMTGSHQVGDDIVGVVRSMFVMGCEGACVRCKESSLALGFILAHAGLLGKGMVDSHQVRDEVVRVVRA
jgi:hypothetical protein